MSLILLVDDEAVVRSLLRLTLEQAGYGVVEAADGRSALRALAQHAVDLVVTDIIMPEMEGIELIRVLRETRPQLPVVAMSGGGILAPSVYLDLAANFGVVTVLAKPFDSAQLLSAVAASLNA